MADAKILERVRRLLALAESDNVNEAANAAAQAQRLMTEHLIDQADIELKTGKTEQTLLHEVFDTQGRAVGWRNNIANALAETNGALLYTARDRVRGVTNVKIVGSAEAIATIRYMTTYLCSEIERLVRKETSENGAAGRRYLNGFRLGAASTLAKRIRAEHQTVIDEAKQLGRGSALALLDRQKGDLARAAGVQLRSGRSTTTNATAFQRGAEAGKTVRLSGHATLGRGAAGSLHR